MFSTEVSRFNFSKLAAQWRDSPTRTRFGSAPLSSPRTQANLASVVCLTDLLWCQIKAINLRRAYLVTRQPDQAAIETARHDVLAKNQKSSTVLRLKLLRDVILTPRKAVGAKGMAREMAHAQTGQGPYTQAVTAQ